MSYRIESGQIVFDTPPPAGAEVQINVSRSNNLNGFSDPNSFYPRRVNEPDTNRLATNDLANQHPVVQAKREDVDDLTGEPKTQYYAQYPYNHVKETESGHIQEFDDTPGRERIHEFHRTGTFYEVHPDGSKVTKIVGNDYEIVHKNKSIRVRGDCKVFVDGDASLYVRGEMNAQIDESLKFNVGKNIDFHAGQNIRMFANQSMEMTSQTTTSINAVGNMQLQTSANMKQVAGGDWATNVKGNMDIIGDGYGVFMFGSDMNLITDTIMDINAGSSMNVTANGAMDLVGATIDLNKAGRAAAAAISAPDLVFLDSGSLDTGIKAWNPEEPDTGQNASSLDAPKSAEVLEPLPFTPLREEDDFMGNDDEEKSPEELRAAVRNGDIRPGSFSDYSYNALEGSFTLQNAERTITTVPRTASELSGDHFDSDVEGDIISPEAGNTSVSPNPTDPANYDENGNMIGGVNYRLQLSNHFTLGQLSANSVVAKTRIQTGGNRGFTQQEIIDNLSNLANNALDLIKDQYPSMIVTNAYRGRQTGSQHNVGHAADMQFPGIPNREYYDIAVWIRENIPHDQLILEFKTTGTRLPWIHLSLKNDSNRAMIFTMMNHSRVGQVGEFRNLA